MGRHYRHGWSRRLTAHRDPHMGPAGTPSRNVLWTGMRALVPSLIIIIVIASLFLCLAPNALAQAPVDDVHVTPRVEPPKADPTVGIDPSLKTHTKPLKVDVNLVLVPVTITDPMNRLVTGLDKENFQLFEGKDQQEIRHFSSEDAPVSIGRDL